jgi:hypothetical protein
MIRRRKQRKAGDVRLTSPISRRETPKLGCGISMALADVLNVILLVATLLVSLAGSRD